jgi:diacylglycerol O-acyltransferase / wax synthase
MLSSLASAWLRTPERLTPGDARLLDLEQRRGVALHVGSVLLFDGHAPSPAELTEHVRARLAHVPRHLRRVVEVPLRQGRPVWVEDPHLHLGYHVHTEALPGDADEAALARLAGRVLSQRLDRGKPLWEVCLVEAMRPHGFALIVKSHAVLVDGGRNRDLVSVLLDDSAASPGGDAGVPAPGGAVARPPPSPAELLAGSLVERTLDPREALETLRALTLHVREALGRVNLDPLARLSAPPPPSPLDGPTGPHRRLVWADAPLEPLRAARERLRGTVNDLVLTAVAGALGWYLRARGVNVDGLVLRALVPVADARGERLLAAHAPLPVGIEDARRRHADISRALDGLRDSGRAAGAGELSALAGFAPTGMLAAAARLAAGRRGCNLVVANVPGPQAPRYLLGRRLRSIYPALPPAPDQALSVAVISYDGRLCFGLLTDHEAIDDPELLGRCLAEALAELAPGA